ncbi:MAG: aminoacyl-tRNA hydrolase [Betaproteobacteria bacterium]|nr:aminoacyl-tRNA hydrolase [Betaproteobacteria bacterium]
MATTDLPNRPLLIDEAEVQTSAIRAQGAGGQNVNKVSSAIHLRFDIPASSLPDGVKDRLMALRDARITGEGVLVIKAQRFRTQDKNRLDAFMRLHELVNSVATPPTPRRATQPTYGSKQRRLQTKGARAQTKSLRAPVRGHDD